MRELWRRVRMLFRGRRFQAELEEEMRLHLELREQELRERKPGDVGADAAAARRAAYRRFGNPAVMRERSYMAWGWGWLESLVQDVRFALRQLRKTPGFTVTAIVTLALGIGANAAIFTLVNAVLLRDLPVANPKALVRIGDADQCCFNGGIEEDGNYGIFPLATYQYLKQNLPEFENLAAVQAGNSIAGVRREGSGSAATSEGMKFVSGNYFQTFGLQAAAGRLLSPQDDVRNAPITAVLSYAAWQRDFAGDPSVVGSTFAINTFPVTIVGIAPEGFYGDRLQPSPPDLYLPIESIGTVAGAATWYDPSPRWLDIIGRVKPNTAMGPLQEKVNVLLRQVFGATNKDFASEYGRKMLPGVHAVLTSASGGIQQIQGDYASSLHLLMWIAGLVLAIACANLANLMLVRGMARRAEVSVRSALGAARMRIVRQMLTESLVLAVMGGVAGLAMAYLGTHALLALAFPGGQDVPIKASPSLAVVGFALALSAVTGMVFGVAPAWINSGGDPAEALRGGGMRTTTGGASLLPRLLVVLQAAMSLVLLVGAGLLTQSLNRIEHQNFKLETKNRYVVHLNPQAAGYKQSQAEALYRTIEERFHELPGVAKVGISTYTPLEGDNWSNSIQIAGQPTPAPDADTDTSFVKANAEYFDAVGTHVVMGRGITTQDTSAAPGVAVVNQAFVRRYLKGMNPIGQRFGSVGPVSSQDWEIVGVVEDSNYRSPREAVRAMYFLPLGQRPKSTKRPIELDAAMYAGAITLATAQPMENMETLVRRTLSSINPNLTIDRFQTFSEQIHGQFRQERLIARLTMLFGLLALLLASVGLYGVTSYGVEQRTQEIGIRMALGETRGGVIVRVLRGAMVQAGIGLAIGVPAALLCVQFVKAQLYGVSGQDVGVMAAAAATLAVAACVAGLVPARRAASVDPAQALRAE